MNRTSTFRKLVLGTFWNFRYRIHLAALLIIIVPNSFTNAQSRERDKPTPLTSNEISGLIDSETRGKFYSYSFIANPGEVSITLTVEPGRKPKEDSLFLSFTGVSFSLFDRNAAEIAGKEVTTANNSGTGQAVTRVEVTRRQSMVLSVHIRNWTYDTSVGGKYRIRIDGPVDVSKDKPFGPKELDALLASRDKAANSSGSTVGSILRDMDQRGCLPKQGTLIVKMKDGSKKIIDLSEAETVTIVP
jgi:hypothetical protein